MGGCIALPPSGASRECIFPPQGGLWSYEQPEAATAHGLWVFGLWSYKQPKAHSAQALRDGNPEPVAPFRGGNTAARRLGREAPRGPPIG